MKLKKSLLPVWVDFEEKWKLIFKKGEKKLVGELSVESEKIIASIVMQIQLEMKDRYTSDFLREHREIDRKHAHFKHQLKQRRIKKWKKFRQEDRGGA